MPNIKTGIFPDNNRLVPLCELFTGGKMPVVVRKLRGFQVQNQGNPKN
jgi:hypothetical protein